MKVVQTFENAFAAELAKGRLINEGIPAVVIHENLEHTLPFSYAIPSLKPQLAVNDQDYEAALELLTFSSASAPEALCCPNCASEEVAFGMGGGSSKERFLRFSLVILGLLTLSAMGKIRPGYYCKSCRTRFSID